VLSSKATEEDDKDSRFNIDVVCHHPDGIEGELERRGQMKTLFGSIEDIDSDDEDPLLVMDFQDIGLKLRVFDHITSETFLRIFHRVNNHKNKKNLPRFHHHIMKKVN